MTTSSQPELVAASALDPALCASIRQLHAHCRENDWAGWDPYDALNSPVFARSIFSRSWHCRLAFTQLLKRLPWNLRPILHIPKQQNPKGIGLFVSALVKLARLDLVAEAEPAALATVLVDLKTSGRDHTCWGYHFDWQCLGALVPKWEPNIICTTFAANALLDLYGHNHDPALLEHALSSGRFLLDVLRRGGAGAGTWFTYTPNSTEPVHNANLLGAAFLARLYSLTGSLAFINAAIEAARYSLRAQRPDGAWSYGEGAHQGWIDSFHTGYNLVALDRILALTGCQEIEQPLRRGYTYFRAHFITDAGIVKYYHDRAYPIDCHCIAQAIITLVALQRLDPVSLDLAWRIYGWAARHMQSPSGVFYYQRQRLFTNRINYIRWTQAWMLSAMTQLLSTLTSE